MSDGSGEPGFWTKIGAFIVSAFAAGFGVWKHTHSRIDGAYKALDDKADKSEMERQRNNISELFRNQNAHREAVLTALSEHGDTLHGIHNTLIQSLAERPTRSEIQGMLNQGRKPR